MMLAPGEHICTACRPLCATTEAQWQNRQRNMTAAPDVQVHPCRSCGSTSWATTRLMIRDAEEKPYQTMLADARSDIFRWWRWIAVAALLFGLLFVMVSCAASRDARHPCQDTNTCEAKR